jgi:hypothetical protein
MAWEKRGGRSYYYRSTRHDGRVVKEYVGAGPAAAIVANLDALDRAERQATVAARKANGAQVAAAAAATCDLVNVSSLLTAAALLAAGYHRSHRHSWRVWRDGRRILESTT